jgi:predicted ATPase
LLAQGVPPDSDYRFKHALIQDAAYENLLKSRRQVLHRRVAETLRDNVAVAAAAEPELLAHHFTQAGLTEAAIEWWGKAGQRSLERSALVEAAEQFTRALAQIATLPSTPDLRRDEIKLQVALITPLMHVKGFATPETKAASSERACLSNKLRSSASFRKTLSCCSQSSTASGSRTTRPSTAMLCASLRRTFWRVPKSKGPQYRWLLGIA